MAKELLACRKDLAYLARDGIRDLLLPDILNTVDFQCPDLLHVPALTEIGFADFPVFDKNQAPDAVDDGKGDGVGAKVVPTEDTPDGGKDEEAGVTMDESEIEGNLAGQLDLFSAVMNATLPFPQRSPGLRPNRRHST